MKIITPSRVKKGSSLGVEDWKKVIKDIEELLNKKYSPKCFYLNMEGIDKKIEKFVDENEKSDLIFSVNENLKKLLNKDEWEYVNLVIERANNVISIGNLEAIKRIRHNNSYHLAPIGFAISD